MIALFTQALYQREPTVIFGDGLNTRDYVHVGDVVAAFRAAADVRRSGQRYNIDTGVQTTDPELHTLVTKILGTVDQPTYYPARPGDVRTSALDSTAATRELGWHPHVDLINGIGRTVDSLDPPFE